MNLIIFVLALLSIIFFSRADIPAHCEFPSQLGTWEFEFTSQNNNADYLTEHCGIYNDISSLLTGDKKRFTFDTPNRVYDDEGLTGDWTYVYDQGFQVNFQGRKYFAYFSYTKNGSEIISHCSQTLTGFVRDDAPRGGNFGCFRAKKIQSRITTTDEQHPNPLIIPEHILDAPFYDEKEVEEINNSQSNWVATEYDRFKGKTFREVIRELGLRPSHPLRSQSQKRHMHMFKTYAPSINSPLPTQFDWTNVSGTSFVPDVRNQKSCGSCYAFGFSGAAMARARVATNNRWKPEMSTQDVVSCGSEGRKNDIFDQGCEGGFAYLIAEMGEIQGVRTEKCFPYDARDESCSLAKCNDRIFTSSAQYLGGYYGATTPELIQYNLIKYGPIATNFEVTRDFTKYKHGIYTGDSTSNKSPDPKFWPTNHVVTIVGYGEENGIKYWKAQNSWSEEWGENGYFRIERGKNLLSFESLVPHYTVQVPSEYSSQE